MKRTVGGKEDNDDREIRLVEATQKGGREEEVKMGLEKMEESRFRENRRGRK